MNSRQSPYLDTYESPALGTTLHTIGKTELVYRDGFFNTWVVLRRDDVLAALRDTTTFTNGAYRFWPLLWSPVSLDGEAHAHKRRTYSHFFTPRPSTSTRP